jgi:hypothetical protein
MTRGLTRRGAQVTSKEEDHKDELVQQSFEDAEPGRVRLNCCRAGGESQGRVGFHYREGPRHCRLPSLLP